MSSGFRESPSASASRYRRGEQPENVDPVEGGKREREREREKEGDKRESIYGGAISIPGSITEMRNEP